MPETEGAAGPAPDSARSRQRISRAVGGYRLIEEGDRILVAVSGGKDSYALLDLLWAARRKAPVRFDLIACHLDQCQPGHDPAPLRDWLDRLGVPFEIVREDTFSAVVAGAERDQEATYCRLCGWEGNSKRAAVRGLLDSLEREVPNVRQVMLGALKNVRPSHLLDVEVAEAWAAQAGNYPARR